MTTNMDMYNTTENVQVLHTNFVQFHKQMFELLKYLNITQ
jgi:hypothetical protein